MLKNNSKQKMIETFRDFGILLALKSDTKLKQQFQLKYRHRKNFREPEPTALPFCNEKRRKQMVQSN